MSHRSHKKPRINKLYSLYVWHRYLGLSAAILVLILAVTGLMLNHTERFQLDQSYVKSNWILDWYKVKLPSKLKSYQVAGQWITQIDNTVYFNQQVLSGHYAQLHGAVELNEMLIVALDDNIILLTADGELIEKLGSMHGVPESISKIGLLNNTRLAVLAHGEVYVADEDLLSWDETEIDTENVKWVDTTELPDAMKNRFFSNYRYHVLPVEKVVLDLHSGRFMGSNGVFIMDAAAIIMALLAISGSSIWIIQVRKRKQNRRKAKRRGGIA